MAKTKLYPENFYMSPFFVIERFKRIVEKQGPEEALNSVKFKAEREAWITAVFLLGLSKGKQDEHWVGINPDDSTPDTYGVQFLPYGKGLERRIMNFEIFEWEKHSKNSLFEAILNKLKCKNYPDYFWLLAYVHGHEGEGLNPEEIFQTLKDRKIPIGSIWMLSSILSENNGDHVIVQLYPRRGQVSFNYLAEAEKRKGQTELIQATGRGISQEFKRMGIKHIPLPK